MPQVPQALRATVYHLSKLPLLGSLARNYYSVAVKACSMAFQRESQVQSAHLFGGTLRRCVPGISDLDFFLIEEPRVNDRAALLGSLQRKHRGLKRIFPILGEIQLISPRLWESDFCASVRELFFSPSRPTPTPPVQEPTLLPYGWRFLNCLEAYANAFKGLKALITCPTRTVPQVSTQRYFRRLLAFAGSGQVESEALNDNLVRAFLELDRLGRQARDEPLFDEKAQPLLVRGRSMGDGNSKAPETVGFAKAFERSSGLALEVGYDPQYLVFRGGG